MAVELGIQPSNEDECHYVGSGKAVTVSDVSEYSTPPPSPDQPGTVDLNTQLNRAYLAGDGAAVERIMAQLATAPRELSPQS
jgi:hypothetical protein